jgi:hypothetical protein
MAPRPAGGEPKGAMAEDRERGPPPAGRARRDDPLMQEVRWRLFRREDLPARLRRLQRLEDAAFGPDGAEPRREGEDDEG